MNNLSPIKSFSVYSLFGTHDVHILFEENIKILVGENGLGKTQVLNILYYTLSRKFERLIEYPFKKITLKFSENHEISFSKKEIEQVFFKHPTIIELIEKIGIQRFTDLQKIAREKESSTDQTRQSLNDIQLMMAFMSLQIPTNERQDILQILPEENLFSENIRRCEKEICQRLSNIEIMYFPTYRRVEEDLKNLGYSDEYFHEKDNNLIHFGMGDVRKRFDEIENITNNLLKDGFSELSSEILNQLVGEEAIFNKNILSKINEKDMEIIFARTGNKISELTKNKIRAVIEKKEIDDKYLIYFLKILIKIYEEQKPLDNFVKIYRDICNKYLIDKKVFYDESAIKIFIKSDITNQEIPLNKLSSGEKQIISIFSKIYLADDKQRFMVLFDEPELSLSIFWQRTLLPDIVNSGKCDFLLAVTHSPFIFENELDRYAIGLNEFIHPIEKVI